MRLLEKLLGKKGKYKEKPSSSEEERGKFMPPPDTPTDDKFILNFKENGGKFLYCASQEDVQSTFAEILKENDWHNTVCCLDDNLKNMFSDFGLTFTPDTEAPFCLITCEFLVANTGALLMSSNQTRQKKISELPYNFVVFAGTSQLVETLGEGLRRIKSRGQDLPTNITSIKNFHQNPEQDGHFLNYGSTAKDLYLLLLEDL